MKKSIIFSVIAIFAILAAACQPQVVTETVVQTQIVEKVVEKVVEVEKKSTCEKPLNIAIIGAMSGTNASLGDWMKKAVTLAVEEKNAAGGIQGCPINLLIYDDEADCTKSVNLAKKVVTEDDVIAAWATTNSTCVLADIPIFQEVQDPAIHMGYQCANYRNKVAPIYSDHVLRDPHLKIRSWITW